MRRRRTRVTIQIYNNLLNSFNVNQEIARIDRNVKNCTSKKAKARLCVYSFLFSFWPNISFMQIEH